jgi:hypothetical protein
MLPATCQWFASRVLFLMVAAALGADAMGQESEQKGIAVQHPNLLLNKSEIEQIKSKVQDHAWATRLFERVKEKAEKDDAVIEASLAYVLTGETKYALSARKRLVRDARDQMQHYEKLDVKAEPEWGPLDLVGCNRVGL